MPLTHEEIKAIKSEIIQECKNIFVQIDDCNTVQAENSKRFANDDKRIDLILLEQRQMRTETKSALRLNNWLTTAVLGALVSGIIGYFFLFA